MIALDEINRQKYTEYENKQIDFTTDCKSFVHSLPAAHWVMEGISPYVGADTILDLIEGSNCTGGWIDLYSVSFLKPLSKLWNRPLIGSFKSKKELYCLSAKFAEFGIQVVAFGDT